MTPSVPRGPGHRHGAALVSSLLLLLLILVAVALFPEERLPVRQWAARLQGAGVPGMGLFLLTGAMATAVGLPRQLLAFTAGLAWGIGIGLLLSWTAALIGCHLTVQLSRHWLRAWVASRYPRVIESLSRLLRHDTFLKVLILRLQPLGTNLMTNLCVGLARVDYQRFLAATAVGYLPQMLIFVLLGEGLRVGDTTRTLVSVGLVLISLLLAGYVYRRYRRRAATSPGHV